MAAGNSEKIIKADCFFGKWKISALQNRYLSDTNLYTYIIMSAKSSVPDFIAGYQQMKKNKVALLSGAMVILSALFLGACGKDKSSAEMGFSSYQLSTVADGADSDSLRNVMEGFDGRWTVNLTGVLPERLGDKDITALRDSLCRMANISIDEAGKLSISLPSELKPLGESDEKAEPDSVKAKGPGSVLTHQLSLDLLTPKIAVFRSYTYSYPEGAAHPVFANGYVNYDIAAGKIIDRTDILTDGFAELLRPAIYNALSEQGVDLQVDKESFWTTKNFRLTPTGIEFIYGIYEIAPYSDGEPTAFFTYQELYSILKPAGKALLIDSDATGE